MKTIHRLDFCSLDVDRYAAYEKMTAEPFRCYLENRPFSTHLNPLPLSFGVEIDGVPVGVAHVSLHTNNTVGELHTFVVEEGETALAIEFLAYIEEEVRKCGSVFFIHFFKKNSFFSSILKVREWSTPRLFMVRVDFDPPTFTTPWLDKEYPLPEGCVLFPWKELTEEERATLKHQERQCRFHYSVSPFGDEESQQPLNSVGLRYKGQVIGWMITHTYANAPTTVRYSSLYIDSDYQFKGLSIRLLQEAIKTQIAHPFYSEAYCEANVEWSDRNWIRFLERRLAPYSIDVVETMQSIKIFK